MTTLVDASKSCLTVQLINPTSQGVSLKPRTCLGTVQPAEVIIKEQLAFTVGSNEVVVSYAHDADGQEVSSQTPSRDMQRQNTGTLPEGVLLDNFPGTEAEKREAERIFREYAEVFYDNCSSQEQEKILLLPCADRGSQTAYRWRVN